MGKDPLDYINEARAQKRQTMKRRFQEFNPNGRFVDRFERVDEKFYLIIFSADWCSDCHVYVPSLAKTLLIASNNMIAARVLDYDNYRDIADEMRVRAVPTMIVYDRTWKELGRFIETPRKFGTVEEEICAIMESKMALSAQAKNQQLEERAAANSTASSSSLSNSEPEPSSSPSEG